VRSATVAQEADSVERARAASPTGRALVERFVDGPELTVNAFHVDGTFVPLTVTDRERAQAFGVATAHLYPAVRGTDEAIAVAEAACAALGLRDGPSYTQVVLGEDGPQVMEVAARLGGGHDAELVEAVTGVPLNDLAIAAALGEDVTLPAPQTQPRAAAAVTRFLVAPPGVLAGVDVPEDLEGVVRVRVYREPGDVITPLRRGADRAGAVLVVGATREEAVARAEAAANRIRFVTADAGALV
jgi:biotin carboxylase